MARSAADFSEQTEPADDYVRVAGDLNGDGVADLCLSHLWPPAAVEKGNGNGYRPISASGADLRFLDGETREPLFPDFELQAFVSTVVDLHFGVGDLDGDGRNEMAVRGSSLDDGRGVLLFVSVHDGRVLRSFGRPGDEPAGLLRELGDLDGEGQRDFAIGRGTSVRDHELEWTLMASGSLEVLGVWRP